MIQRSPAHVGERCDLDDPSIHVFLYFFGLKHIIQRIVEWTQIGEYFLLEITRQKSESFSCFNRRTSQDDPLHLFLSERVHTHSHRKVSLACSSGAHSKYDIKSLNRLDVAQLLFASRDDRGSTRRSQNLVAGELPKRLACSF